MTKTRHVPPGYELHKRQDETGAEVYFRTVNGVPYGIGWKSDKQVNTDFHHRFRSEDERAKFVARYFDGLLLTATAKQERRGKVAALNNQPNPFKVGDILTRSWGYDQTNVDFYQVIEVRAKSVVIREIGSEVVDDDAQGIGSHHSMASYVVARKDKFKGEPMTKLVKWCAWDKVPTPYLTFDHGDARLWDGRKKYESYYA